MSNLLEPINIGGKLPLRNRIAMGSMTRNRCIDDMKPGPAQVSHYGERARHGTGLIITEGTLIDWGGLDWQHAPVMITDAHAEAWGKVVSEVHKQGGKIFIQAWHLGRCQHDQMPIMVKTGRPVLAPSSIKAEGGKYRDLPGHPGHTDNITVIEDPREVVDMYKHSMSLAKKAGFDGVEFLAQGGFLPHQFLNSRANHRTDAYGGSVENRCRFVLEAVDAISEVFGGHEFVSAKISPTDVLNDSVVTFGEMKQTYTYLITELVRRKVGIITISRRGSNIGEGPGDLSGMWVRPEGYELPEGYDPVLDFGPLVKYPGSSTMLMANYDYSVEEADGLVREGKIDMDLIHRIRHGIAFAENDRGDAVSYGPYSSPDENYNDWPTASA